EKEIAKTLADLGHSRAVDSIAGLLGKGLPVAESLAKLGDGRGLLRLIAAAQDPEKAESVLGEVGMILQRHRQNLPDDALAAVTRLPASFRTLRPHTDRSGDTVWTEGCVDCGEARRLAEQELVRREQEWVRRGLNPDDVRLERQIQELWEVVERDIIREGLDGARADDIRTRLEQRIRELRERTGQQRTRRRQGNEWPGRHSCFVRWEGLAAGPASDPWHWAGEGRRGGAGDHSRCPRRAGLRRGRRLLHGLPAVRGRGGQAACGRQAVGRGPP